MKSARLGFLFACMYCMFFMFGGLPIEGHAQGLSVLRTQEKTQDASQAKIEWALTNPFRLFQSPEMTNFHRIIYEQLTAEELANPVLSVERRLTEHLPRGWAEELISKTCWSRKAGRYSACLGSISSYLHPKKHKVWVRLGGVGLRDLLSLKCEWSLWRRGKKRRLLKRLRQNCDEKLEFEVPYPIGGRVELKISDGRVLRQDIKVRDIFVVGIGDSFGSGEGNPDVPVKLSSERHVIYGAKDKKIKNDYFLNRGYPTRVGDWREVGDSDFMREKALWMSQSCHRSLYSHQLRASLQLALDNPQRAVTFVGYACAGAEITHGLFLKFKGNEWSERPPRRSQISAIAQAQCGGWRARETQYSRAFGLDGKLEVLHDLPVLKCARKRARKIDLLMVSIGGNDVRFSSLVANVVIKDVGKLKLIGGWMGHIISAQQARQNFSELKLRYKALNRALHNVLHVSWKQSDRILLTGYPNMSFKDEGRNICSDGSLGMSVAPIFSLSSVRAVRAEKFADQLNDQMRREAKRYKWTFVEAHRPKFLRHGICASRGESADNPSESLKMPFWENDRWAPFNPADYKPFVSRERWFRTPNDAYLTGHLHLSGPVIRNIFKYKGLDRLQVLIAGTYSGAFHPTAEGQAVIADSLAIEAKRVLKKYNQ